MITTSFLFVEKSIRLEGIKPNCVLIAPGNTPGTWYVIFPTAAIAAKIKSKFPKMLTVSHTVGKINTPVYYFESSLETAPDVKNLFREAGLSFK